MSNIPLVAAIICAIVLQRWNQQAAAQNASMGGNACMSCGPTIGTNMTNSTLGGNATNDTLSNPLLDKKNGNKTTASSIIHLSD